MNSEDMDRLLEQDLGGDPPQPIFRARVLRDSTAAFVRARRRRAPWRLTVLTTAAAFIAAVSFLLGRCSVPRPVTGPAGAGAAETIAVPGELVAWLDAGRFFRQMGMDHRAARAYDRAGKLLPPGAGAASGMTGQVPATETAGLSQARESAWDESI